MPKELHTPDIPLEPPPSIKVSATEKFVRPTPDAIEPVDKPLDMNYLRSIAFQEEPVTILVHPSNEEFAPMFRECWVNGIGCEAFLNNKWVPIGSVPVGQPVTIKRKYAEVFAMSRTTNVKTMVRQFADRDPINDVQRTPIHNIPFSVVKDESPYGKEWLERLMRQVA